MTRQEAREKLEFAVSKMADEQEPMVPAKALRPIMAAADAYGDARELEGHVAACEERKGAGPQMAGWSIKCGDDWYCERAPRRTA